MEELRIPLPEVSGGRVPQTLSYRWCKALHEALQPLLRYELVDGSEAFGVDVAFGYKTVVRLESSFDSDDAQSSNFLATKPVPENFVCRILIYQSSGVFISDERFALEDFLGDAVGAREKFAKVVEHIRDHCMPQVAPQWINEALAALKR